MVFVRSVFGVPNIKGGFLGRSLSTASSYGCVGDGWEAFSTTLKGATKKLSYVEVDSSQNDKGDSTNFSASRSSSIYQDNANLRPQSISILVLLKL